MIVNKNHTFYHDKILFVPNPYKYSNNTSMNLFILVSQCIQTTFTLNNLSIFHL